MIRTYETSNTDTSCDIKIDVTCKASRVLYSNKILVEVKIT